MEIKGFVSKETIHHLLYPQSYINTVGWARMIFKILEDIIQ